MSLKRRRQFLLGRLGAHSAIAALQIPHISPIVGIDDNRLPVWPPEVCGSISHSGDRVAVAIGRSTDYQTLGLDLQHIVPLKHDIRRHIATEFELDIISAHTSESDLMTLMLFSAKECFYKAFFPLTKHFLGFKDVTARFNIEENCFLISLNDPTSAPVAWPRETPVSLNISEGYILSSVWLNANF